MVLPEQSRHPVVPADSDAGTVFVVIDAAWNCISALPAASLTSPIWAE